MSIATLEQLDVCFGGDTSYKPASSSPSLLNIVDGQRIGDRNSGSVGLRSNLDIQR